MLSRDNKPKLVDFGFSKQIHSNPMLATYCGSTLYASPEMIFGKAYRGPECDIWSLGVILFCMLTACMPFDDQNWGQFVTCIDRSDYPEPENVSESKYTHLPLPVPISCLSFSFLRLIKINIYISLGLHSSLATVYIQ